MRKTTIMTVVVSVIWSAVTAQVAQAQTYAAPTDVAQINAAPRAGRGGFGGGFGLGGGARGPAVPAITTNTPGMPGVPMPDPAVGR